jgi:hypothetical protein
MLLFIQNIKMSKRRSRSKSVRFFERKIIISSKIDGLIEDCKGAVNLTCDRLNNEGFMLFNAYFNFAHVLDPYSGSNSLIRGFSLKGDRRKIEERVQEFRNYSMIYLEECRKKYKNSRVIVDVVLSGSKY